MVEGKGRRYPETRNVPVARALPWGARDLLAEGWEVDDDRRRRLLATLKLVIDFHTWRSLERESGLSREEAVESMLEAVRSAVSRPGTP